MVRLQKPIRICKQPVSLELIRSARAKDGVRLAILGVYCGGNTPEEGIGGRDDGVGGVGGVGDVDREVNKAGDVASGRQHGLS